jgi:beta-1,4-N-acetylglucosaminyltransferase
MPTVFFTVGSTKFDALIEAALSDDVVAALMARGMRAMVVQYGNSQIQDQFKIESTLHDMGIAVELWQWKPSLKQVIESSDLVVSHAGIY